jgi:hypothetical protein
LKRGARPRPEIAVESGFDCPACKKDGQCV